MRTSSRGVIAAILFTMVFILAVGGVASAKVDFSDKTVTIIVPFGVGGGTDVTARIYAPYFSKYLPGNPTVVVENVAGGGGIVGANHFAMKAKADGTEIFVSSGSVTFPMLFNQKGVRYNYGDWRIIFAQPVGSVVYTRSDSGIKTLEDLKTYKKTLHFASSGPSSVDTVAIISLDILGLDVKATHGYEGSGARRVANEQGEANVDYQTTPAYLKNVVPLIEQGLFLPLYSYGALDDDGMIVRQPEVPDMVTFKEAYKIVKGEEAEGPAWDAWKSLFIAGVALQKPAFLPGDASDEVLQVYRDAVKKMRADPDFQKDMQAKLGGYPPVVGETAQKALKEMLEISPDCKSWIKKWFKDKMDVTIK